MQFIIKRITDGEVDSAVVYSHDLAGCATLEDAVQDTLRDVFQEFLSNAGDPPQLKREDMAHGHGVTIFWEPGDGGEYVVATIVEAGASDGYGGPDED